MTNSVERRARCDLCHPAGVLPPPAV